MFQLIYQISLHQLIIKGHTMIKQILFIVMMSVMALSAANINLNLGGQDINVTDAAKAMTDVLHEAHKVAEKNRAIIQEKIQQLRRQRISVAQAFSVGEIRSQAEYEQRLRNVDEEIVRLEKRLEQGDELGQKIGQGVQHMVTSGWDAMVEMQREKERRETQIAIAGVSKMAENEGALERLKYLTDKDVLVRTGAACTLVGGTLIGSYYGFSLIHSYIKTKIDTPRCVTETSVNTWHRRLYEWVMGVPDVTHVFDDLVLNQDLDQQVKNIAEDMRLHHDLGLPLRNILLYGPPGTGKTTTVRKLAEYVGMDYALTTGPALAQCKPGEDIRQLIELFDWAERSPKGLLLFFDEIDALVMRVDQQSTQGKNLLAEFKARTGTASNKIAIIGATNMPEMLDGAFLSRINTFLEVPLPTVNERFRLLKTYIKKYIIDDVRQVKSDDGYEASVQLSVDSIINDLFLQQVAEKIETFSGRDIEKMIDEMRSVCHRPSNNRTLTELLFNQILEDKIKQKNAKASFLSK